MRWTTRTRFPPSAIAWCMAARSLPDRCLIDDKVLDSIDRFVDLVPLHNPANLTGIRAAMHALPDVPHVACFDTAFHATIPKVAYLYALPYAVYEQVRGAALRIPRLVAPLRRGPHGRTAGPVSRRHELHHRAPGQRLFDHGRARSGKSADTSMGLTPLEGLVMGTRSGDIDPAILFYLSDKGYDLAALNQAVQQAERPARRVGHFERHAHA